MRVLKMKKLEGETSCIKGIKSYDQGWVGYIWISPVFDHYSLEQDIGTTFSTVSVSDLPSWSGGTTYSPLPLLSTISNVSLKWFYFLSYGAMA